MEGDEAIRRRAHELWEAEGRPASRQLDHWFQAKEETAWKTLGSATYKATQQDSVVMVTASGSLPAHGMRAALESNRLEPGDPDYPDVSASYMLIFRQSALADGTGPVPFQVTATIESRGSISKVLVFDRDGPHLVKVAQPRKVATKPPKVVAAPVTKPAARKRSKT